MYRIERIGEPAELAVSLADAKAHLRVDGASEDALIESLIRAAMSRVEAHCNRAFVSCSYAITREGALPEGQEVLALPLPEITAITSVGYVDADDADQTISFGNYTFVAARNELRPLASWPAGRDLRIVVTAGNDDSPVVLPFAVRAAVLLYVADLFELRSAHVVGTIYAKNPAAEALLAPWRERLGL